MRKIFLTLTLSSLALYSTAFANTEAADEINELLRGEISAVETYRQALEKVGNQPGAEDLTKALKNHEKAVAELQKQVAKAGGVPSTESGAWGVWAETVTGTAKLLGDKTALKALKEGEEHGIKEYKDALQDEDVPADTKQVIRESLLPNQLAHIQTIDKMMSKL